jgi:hypothetical protein
MADMPKTEFRNDGQIDIKGVNLIESDDKLLSELGLGKSPNGINIWLKGEGRSPMVCTLLVSGGLSMRENEKENKQTVPFKNLMPRLITDNAGNKRLAIFDDNSSLAQYSRRIEDNGPADGSRNVMADFKTTVLINDNKSDSSGLKPDNAPDQLGRINSPRINLHIEGLDTNWSRQFRQLNVQLDTLLKGRLKDVEAMLKKLNIDNGNIRKFIVPPIGMPNKEMKELEQKAADLEKQALGLDKEALGLEKKALRIEKDARKQNKMQSLEKSGKLREDAIELHDKASDLRDRALELREKAMQIREKSFELPDTSDFNFDMNFDFDYPDSDSDEDINMNDIINDVKIRISNNITPIMTRIDALEDNMNNLVKINKLIPIEVKMGRNPDRNYYNNNEDFSFILCTNRPRNF